MGFDTLEQKISTSVYGSYGYANVQQYSDFCIVTVGYYASKRSSLRLNVIINNIMYKLYEFGEVSYLAEYNSEITYNGGTIRYGPGYSSIGAWLCVFAPA